MVQMHEQNIAGFHLRKFSTLLILFKKSLPTAYPAATVLEITPKDPTIYEYLDNEIVLDTNVLQSVATDLHKRSGVINREVIGSYFRSFLQPVIAMAHSE